jgi:AraC-like DNA-binding protein
MAESVRFVRVRDLPGVELMVARGFRHLWRTFRTQYEVVLMEDGGADWRLGMRRYRSVRGSVYLIAPGDFHAGLDVRERSNFSSLLLPEALVVDDLGRPLRFRTHQLEDPQLTRLAARLMRAVATGAPSWRIESLTSAFVSFAAERAGEGGEPARRPPVVPSAEERVARMRAWLHDRDAAMPSLGELAAAVGVSRYRALREFKRHTGVTPFAYLNAVRLTRAADLLRRGWSGTEAAHEVGFADQSHLIRHFRHQWRITPGRYVRG